MQPENSPMQLFKAFFFYTQGRGSENLSVPYNCPVSVGNKGKYWVGADDLVTEGQFLWSDESSLPIDDPVWVSGEPNGRSNENCVQIYTDPNNHVTRRYRLNDARCSGEISFVCQIDI